MDLLTLLKITGLTEEQLAIKLFPNHDYPKHALKYVLEGKRELKQSELLVIAELSNCDPIVFKKSKTWQFEDNKISNILSFRKGNYIAMYDATKSTVKILLNGEEVAERLIIQQAIRLTDFIAAIDNLIASYEEKQK